MNEGDNGKRVAGTNADEQENKWGDRMKTKQKNK